MMLDHFAGQKIEKALPAPVEGTTPDEAADAPKAEASEMSFPVKQFDTLCHVSTRR